MNLNIKSTLPGALFTLSLITGAVPSFAHDSHPQPLGDSSVYVLPDQTTSLGVMGAQPIEETRKVTLVQPQAPPKKCNGVCTGSEAINARPDKNNPHEPDANNPLWVGRKDAQGEDNLDVGNAEYSRALKDAKFLIFNSINANDPVQVQNAGLYLAQAAKVARAQVRRHNELSDDQKVAKPLVPILTTLNLADAYNVFGILGKHQVDNKLTDPYSNLQTVYTWLDTLNTALSLDEKNNKKNPDKMTDDVVIRERVANQFLDDQEKNYQTYMDQVRNYVATAYSKEPSQIPEQVALTRLNAQQDHSYFLGNQNHLFAPTVEHLEMARFNTNINSEVYKSNAVVKAVSAGLDSQEVGRVSAVVTDLLSCGPNDSKVLKVTTRPCKTKLRWTWPSKVNGESIQLNAR